MAVNISAIFKLADQMSDKMDKIGNIGDKAMSRIEQSSTKADRAFSRSQSSASKLSAVYKNFEGNAEQLAGAVQRGEKQLSAMEKTEGKTAATTFEYSTKLDAAKEAQENLERAMTNANKAAQNYENAVSNNATTAEELKSAEDELETATKELFEAFDKGANAALDLEEASEKAEKELDDFADEADDAAKKGEDFGKKTGSAVESLEQLLVSAGIAVAVKEITSELLDCAAAAETVETSAAKLETLAGSNNMSMLSDQIYTISAASGTAQEDLYEVAYNAISAGTDVKKAGEMTEAANKLATAGFTTSTAALSVLTTATNSYGKAAGSATDITDGLITVQNLGVTTVGELANSMGKSISTAAAYNVSLDNLESAYISVTKAGISTQEGTTYINAMINELGKSSSDVAKILKEETGQSFGELMDSGKSLADVLQILYDKSGKNSEAMMNLWGSQTAAVASAAIVNQGLGEFNTNLETLKNSAGATEKAYKTMSDTTEFAHNKMKNSAENLKVSIGQALNPTLEKLYKKASEIFEGAAKFIKDHPGVVKAITAVVVTIGTFTVAVTAAKIAMAALTAVMNTNPFVLAFTAVGALTAGLIALASSESDAKDRSKELTSSSQKQKEELDELNKKYEKYKGTVKETSPEANRLKGKIDELTTSFENNKKTIQDTIDDTDQHLKDAEEHVQSYKDTIKQIDDQRLSTYALIQKLEDLVAQNDKTESSEKKIKAVIEELNKQLPGLALNFEKVTNGGTGYVEMMKKAAEIKYNSDKQTAQSEAYVKALKDREKAEKDYAENKANFEKEMAEGGYKYYESGAPHAVKGDVNNTYKNKPGWYEDWTHIEDFVGEVTHSIPYDPEQNESYKKMKESEEEIERQRKIIDETEEAWKKEAEAAEYAAKHPKDAAEAATTALEKQKTAIQNLCTEYANAYDSAKKSYEGQFTLFEQAKMYHEGDEDQTTFEKSTVDSAQKALDSQLEYWKTYNSNINEIKKLSAKDLGITEDQYKSFMSNIQDGSETAAGLAQSMVEKIKSGNKDSVKELAQTYTNVQEQQEKAANSVADWKTDFENKLKDIKKKMEDTIDEMEMTDDARTAAKNTIDAYAKSLRQNMSSAVSAAQDVASAVNKALQSADMSAGMTAGKGWYYFNTTPSTDASSTTSTSGYALGTDYATAGVHVVGENGPELVLFKGGEEVIPADETAKIFANSSDGGVPTSLPVVTHSDSESATEGTQGEKTYNLNINGSGSIKVDGSTSKEEVVAILMEKAKPIFMSILEDEITEEGDDSYDY